MFFLFLENLGMTEMVLIAVVALIIFGPRKLPEIARQIGKAMSDFKKVSSEFRETWEREVAFENEINSEVKSEKAQITSNENVKVNHIGEEISNENTSLVEFEHKIKAENAEKEIEFSPKNNTPLIREIQASQFKYIENKASGNEIDNSDTKDEENLRNTARKREWL